MEDEAAREDDRVEFHDYYKFKVSYVTQKSLNLTFLFVTGLTDKFDNVKKELVKCRKEFINFFEEILQHRFDAKTFEVFDPIVDVNHKNLRPKISLVGFSGVGKTTITKLIRAEEIPIEHIPTITGDIATVRIGKLHFHLWDFAGQEQFSYLWNNFIKGSDAVLLITESTLENIDKSKFFLELIKEQAPHAHTAVIGNKQDLEGAIKSTQIERILGLKTYSMIANDPNNRDKMIQIIADILEMSAEVSPLLKPLFERDRLIEDATKAIKSANFDEAAFLFDKISYLCIELGDDSLGKEFYEKSQKIRTMLEQVGAPPPTSASPEKEIKKDLKIPESSEEVIDSKPVNLGETKKIQQPSKPPKPILPPSNLAQKQIPDHERVISPRVKHKTSKEWIKSSKALPEPLKVKEPQNHNKNIGLKLNPEDFMVKIRPKTIGVIPKDAKNKLKTSAFGHIKNVSKSEKTVLKNDTKDANLSGVKPPSRPSEIFKKETRIPSEPHLTSDPLGTPNVPENVVSEPKIQEVIESKVHPIPENIKKSLIELKLKKADLYKMSLEFDMKELSGEITEEELGEKKNKISKYEKEIEDQILELQKLLKE
ncbi:hypothetical protein LCGC14_0566180 [marine sediment metagenome]|uniref:GTP-binding protein n=1 Tax=marine sediment metagenome TaxID=412755 RepID=A0A0F9U6W5_9ZZZZ